MSIRRGSFELVCDGRCGVVVTLTTSDFEEAKEEASEHREQEGWTLVQRGGKYADLCPSCGGR